MKSSLSKYISSDTTTTVCSNACVLNGILIGETAAGAITIKDGDTTVAVLKSSISEGYYDFDGMVFNNSLVVETGAASKITVLYSPAGN